MTQPLTCTQCRSPVDVVEDIRSVLVWGPAVVDATGTVRPADPARRPPVVMADNAQTVGRPRACCTNPECGHQWRLKRPFSPMDPTAAVSA